MAMDKKKAYALGFELERVLEAGYTGRDTGGGKALLFDVRKMGSSETDMAKRVDVLMHHEAAISIYDSGVQVSM